MKKLQSIFSWNGYYYGCTNGKKQKFYKSKTVRFDDTFGGIIEVTAEEFFEKAEKYATVMR